MLYDVFRKIIYHREHFSRTRAWSNRLCSLLEICIETLVVYRLAYYGLFNNAAPLTSLLVRDLGVNDVLAWSWRLVPIGYYIWIILFGEGDYFQTDGEQYRFILFLCISSQMFFIRVCRCSTCCSHKCSEIKIRRLKACLGRSSNFPSATFISPAYILHIIHFTVCPGLRYSGEKKIRKTFCSATKRPRRILSVRKSNYAFLTGVRISEEKQHLKTLFASNKRTYETVC